MARSGDGGKAVGMCLKAAFNPSMSLNLVTFTRASGCLFFSRFYC